VGIGSSANSARKAFRRARARRIRDGTEAPAAAEHHDAHAEARERLADLEADHAGPNTATDFGRSCQSKTSSFTMSRSPRLGEHRRASGREPGGDHDRARLDARPSTSSVFASTKRACRECGRTRESPRSPPARSPRSGRARAHARHHLAAVDCAPGPDARRSRRPIDRVRGFRRRDEELGRHAADARAGRAVGAALDEDGAAPPARGRAVGREARRARADHGDID
jgi:hypothetical protein